MSSDYESRLAAESRKWGDHLRVEATGEWHAWLDHPLVAAHYQQLGLIDGLPWERWVTKALGRPARRSLDLGCGSGLKSVAVWQAGSTAEADGIDVSEERVAEGEKRRASLGMPGAFRVGDVNACRLTPSSYDLIFSSHSFHHFVELEHIMAEVAKALTPGGLFVLEEFVGPTQFQWTDQQIDLVRSLMTLLPEEFRMLRWNAVKPYEGRPTVAEVVAASPFESIRSAEIVPLFRQHFDIVETRALGGTLQHLLYNGIVHNFGPEREAAEGYVRAFIETEDALIESGLLPSDFMLLVGRARV
jgi:ubiquinone/menaquinone biosynthesis C-methylase UbiE